MVHVGQNATSASNVAKAARQGDTPPSIDFRGCNDPELIHHLDGYDVIRHSREPFSTSASFSEGFTGSHPKYGKVAMTRPRTTDGVCTMSQLRHFRTVAEIWKQLQHPHILQLIGMIHSEGKIWFISPFASNGSLENFIRYHPGKNRTRWIHELADAVAYLHRRKVVHGNIKCYNVLMSDDLGVRLSGFAHAKMGEMTTLSSLKGGVAFDVGWMAPELLPTSDFAKTPASDVYAFGITVYEILSGCYPFNHLDLTYQIIKAVLNNERPPMLPSESQTGVSYAPFWAAAKSCWDGDPSNRPSMEEVCERLRSLAASTNLATEEEFASGPASFRDLEAPVEPLSNPEGPSIGDLQKIQLEEPFVAEGSENLTLSQSLSRNDFALLDGERPFFCGSYSDVFRAYHKTRGLVAVKRPRLKDPIDLQSVKTEAKIWQALKHRHILPLVSIIENDHQFYFISPLLLKGTVPKYVNDNPGVTRRKLIQQLASAIGYLHSKGIVHGDIKGNNALVSDDGELVLCDFGLSKSLGEGMTTDTRLKGGGTLYWQAPELHGFQEGTAANEELEFDVKKTFKTDVYAFGITISEILTGKQPFNRVFSIPAFVMAIGRRTRPTMEPKASPSGESYIELWGVASWCWDGDPLKRPNMADVCKRFGVPIESPPNS